MTATPVTTPERDAYAPPALPPVSPLDDAGHAALRRQLERSATAFEFAQVVRALERLTPQRAPVGRFGDPAAEVARFTAHPSLAFPSSDVEEVKLAEAGGSSPARVEVNFFGLIGPAGVLPRVYTQYVAERSAARDTALRDFLDLFQHRLLSLFYRGWRAAHPHVAVGEDGDEDRLTAHLRDLAGLGTPALHDRLGVADAALLSYVGLVAPQTRPAGALRQLLSTFFGVPCEVEQFVGAWYPVAAGTQCSLGAEDECTSLGIGTVVGDAVWDHLARIRVRLGPLTRAQYDEFLPGAAGYRSLRAITQYFTGDQLDVELQLVLARDEVPAAILGDEGGGALGWASWLRTREPARDPDDTVLLL